MTMQSATAMDRLEIEMINQSDEDIFSQSSNVYEVVARRAFEIFENHGGSSGHDLEDWLRAESELLHAVPLNLIESNQGYVVRAEVPGFGHGDIEINVKPRRLTIAGKRGTKEESTSEKLIWSEWRANRIFRTLDLPADVDPRKVRATLMGGILTIDLPKAHSE
jgi:HSP20 family molecular chaperone IbpA